MQAKLTSGYFRYYQEDGSLAGIKLATFKNIDAANGYKLDYVRYAPVAVNFIIGRFIYWSNRKNKPQDSIIITNKDLAKTIGCHEVHASEVMNRIRDLFDLEFIRQGNRGGSRRIKLNKAFIEFLKVFTEDDYTEYVETYNITDSKELYALRQIYKYRLFSLTDNQLSDEQKLAKQEYLEYQRNFFHYVATSDKSTYKRIDFLDQHQDKLTSIEKKQLERIKKESKLGKLVHYLHKVLIKIENHISAILMRMNEEPKEETTDNTASTDRNKTKGEQATTKQVTALRQKEPEADEDHTPTLTKITGIVKFWNMMCSTGMPEVKRITEQRTHSIGKLISKYGYRKVIFAIRNTSYLYHDEDKYKYKMTLERFSVPKTIEYLIDLKDYDTRINPGMRRASGWQFMNYTTIESDMPEFRSIKEANSWLEANAS